MKRMALSNLQFDEKLHPRQCVDDDHVFGLIEAIRANATLPPLVICRKTNKVVDGFHRGKAYRRVYGPDYEVDVVEKEYKTPDELFLDAVRYNAKHGRSMTTADRAKVVQIAETLKIDDARIGEAMCVSAAMLGGLKARGNDGASLTPARKRRFSVGAGPQDREASKAQTPMMAKNGMTVDNKNHELFDRVIAVVAKGINRRDAVLVHKAKKLKAILNREDY